MTNQFKEKDTVVMHTCIESNYPPTNDGKIWVCRSDSFDTESNKHVVFLEGLDGEPYSGSFDCKYLQKVDISCFTNKEEEFLIKETKTNYFEEQLKRGYNKPIVQKYNVNHELSLISFHWKSHIQGMSSENPQDVIDFIICKDTDIDKRKENMYDEEIKLIQNYKWDYHNFVQNLISPEVITRLTVQIKFSHLRNSLLGNRPVTQEDFHYLKELIYEIARKNFGDVFEKYVLNNISVEYLDIMPNPSQS